MTPLLDAGSLQHEVRGLFGSGRRKAAGATAIGCELELIPVGSGGAVPTPEESDTLSHLAASLSSRGRFSFEPGGQIEYSTPACASVAELVGDTDSTLTALAFDLATKAGGLTLVPRGLAPWFGPGAVGLRQPSPRYVEMDRYFRRFGPWGPWMMRLTASLQVNLDFGPDDVAVHRWRVGNLLAPVLVAAFANSPAELVDGTITPAGRTWVWSRLDDSRTGEPGRRSDVTPWAAYMKFALTARVMFDAAMRPLDIGSGDVPRFNDWWLTASSGKATRPAPTLEDWRTHLGTLFPDVRPRGWMEVRSIDVPEEPWWSVPTALLAALMYDDRALHEVEELLAGLDGSRDRLIERACTNALRDPLLAGAAGDVFRIAEDAVPRFAPGYFGDPAATALAAFRERYVEAGRTQADEARERGEVAILEAEATTA